MCIQKHNPIPIGSTVSAFKTSVVFILRWKGELRRCCRVAAAGYPLRPTQKGLQSGLPQPQGLHLFHENFLAVSVVDSVQLFLLGGESVCYGDLLKS